MVQIFKHEITKIKSSLSWVVGFFLVLGVLPYLHFHVLDGEVYNRVLTFNDGVDPSALHTELEAYCPGDPVYIKNNFTKNRPVSAVYTYWWISNGSLKLALTDTSLANGQLPLGSYPPLEKGRILTYAHQIPEDADPGLHVSVGLSTHVLLNGETREQNYRTLRYLVKSQEECQ